MKQINTKYLELTGTNYDIGYRLGQRLAQHAPEQVKQAFSKGALTQEDFDFATELFDRWCPGLNEEIQGFADALKASPSCAIFYAFTSLKPRCSQIVCLPKITANAHVLMARSYEFSERFEEFALIRTSVRGKHTHIGTSIAQFGRDEGINEHGLGITMSSCGFPVGALPEMRKPAIRGLQFWAVVRTVLENCVDIGEALAYIKDMPIAYNLNLIVADKWGRAALVETLDGKMAVKQIDDKSEVQHMHATNHAILPELLQIEPIAMRNSVVRYDAITAFLKSTDGVNVDTLKELLLKKYPQGLCCHWFDEFLGTTKSVIFDLTDGTIDLCWGGLSDNGWQHFDVAQPLEECVKMIRIIKERATPDVFETIHLQ